MYKVPLSSRVNINCTTRGTTLRTTRRRVNYKGKVLTITTRIVYLKTGGTNTTQSRVSVYVMRKVAICAVHAWPGLSRFVLRKVTGDTYFAQKSMDCAVLAQTMDSPTAW